jgi:zinc-ribbon domain
MPYCHNCGAKLDDDARFCSVCGTPVAPVSPVATSATPQRTSQRPRRTTFPLAGIVLIAILVIAVVGLAIAFVPLYPVSVSQSNEAAASNVNTLRLVLNADVANVNVLLKDLPGNQRAAVNVSATGWRGIFGTDRPLTLGFKEDTSNSTLTYSVNVSRAEGWTIFNTLDVTCDVFVDPSVKLDITVRTETGSVTMNADREMVLQNLNLQATTGSVEAILKEGVNVSGGLSLQTTTGSVRLQWDEVKISRSIPVNVMTTTGSAEVNITQSRQLAGNVTLNAQTTTGGVNFAMNIQNDVGARIAASTTLGGTNVQQSGFSGNQAPLQSSNYPAGSNFIVTLSATTGGIDIDAVYQLGGVRS